MTAELGELVDRALLGLVAKALRRRPGYVVKIPGSAADVRRLRLAGERRDRRRARRTG